jgi:hypothetical protein
LAAETSAPALIRRRTMSASPLWPPSAAAWCHLAPWPSRRHPWRGVPAGVMVSKATPPAQSSAFWHLLQYTAEDAAPPAVSRYIVSTARNTRTRCGTCSPCTCGSGTGNRLAPAGRAQLSRVRQLCGGLLRRLLLRGLILRGRYRRARRARRRVSTVAPHIPAISATRPSSLLRILTCPANDLRHLRRSLGGIRRSRR